MVLAIVLARYIGSRAMLDADIDPLTDLDGFFETPQAAAPRQSQVLPFNRGDDETEHVAAVLDDSQQKPDCNLDLATTNEACAELAPNPDNE